MTLTPATRSPAALERSLGDPRDPTLPTSFAAALAADAAESFPAAAFEALDAVGMSRCYVPAADGGSLDSLEDLAAVVRAVARRDLTLAIAHAKTFLGAAPIWVAGCSAQRERLAAAVIAGQRVSLGLTEEAHGGDLLATETFAARDGDGYRLTGTKWLINNATRGDALAVFARTDPRGGARGFSLLLVRKADDPRFTCLPKIATHGIRGADISGVRFEGCAVPASARVGAEGQGLELIMKVLQVTRSFVPALSLGALDTGLRHVLAFARSRRIGGGAVVELPHARGVLADAFVELLLGEAVTRVTARSVSAAPERLAVTSAVAKYLVPTRVDAALGSLAVVLGARHYLRGDLLEKVRRDHSLVALFDGSTVVNLNALAQELPRLHDPAARRDDASYRLAEPAPPFCFERLDLVARGDDLVTPLAHARERILTAPELAPELRAELAARVGDVVAGLRATTGAHAPRERSLAQSPEAFANAARFARYHAARSCVLAWVESRHALDDFFAGGEWLGLALGRLLDPERPPAPPAWRQRVFERLLALDAAGATFAFEPLTAETAS